MTCPRTASKLPGACLEQLLGWLGAVLGHLGLSWAVLGPNMGHLAPGTGFGGSLGPPSWTVLSYPGAQLGLSWTIFGTPWRLFGVFLMPSWGHLWYVIGAFLVPSVAQLTKMRPSKQCSFPIVKLHFLSGDLP